MLRAVGSVKGQQLGLPVAEPPVPPVRKAAEQDGFSPPLSPGPRGASGPCRGAPARSQLLSGAQHRL